MVVADGTMVVAGGKMVVGPPGLLTMEMTLCTSCQAAETVMVRVVGRVAATVCRTAWVLLARVSRAPAVAANTAQKVSSASQRYSPLGRYRRFTPPPPREVRRPGPVAGRRRARRPVRE